MKPALITALALSLGACSLPSPHAMLGLDIGPGWQWVREGTSARDTQIAMFDCAEAVPDPTSQGFGSLFARQEVFDRRGACMREQGYVLFDPNGRRWNRII